MIAGALFAGGSGLLTVSLVMGMGGMIVAAMLFLLPRALRRLNYRDLPQGVETGAD